MKKDKIFFVVLMLTVLFSLTYAITACVLRTDDSKHTHTYSSTWSYDASYHWQACSRCDEVRNKSEHDWNEGVVTLQPTETGEGIRTFFCKVCGQTKIESVPSLTNHEHSYSVDWTWNDTHHWRKATCVHTTERTDYAEHAWDDGVDTKIATETEVGVKTYTCTVCTKTRNEVVPQITHVHTYAEEWSNDEEYHWHTSTCGHDDEISEKRAHVWDEGTITKIATETEVGTKTYTCTVCAKTRDEILPFTTHVHTYSKEWSHDSEYHWHFATCDHIAVKSDEGLHLWQDTGKIITEATNTNEGEKEQKCSECRCIRVVKTGLLGHVHEYEKNWTYNGEYHWYASSCGHEAFVLEKVQHSWDEGIVIKQATVYDEGIITYTCNICGAKKEGYIPKLESFAVIFLDKDNRTISARNYELSSNNIQIPSNIEYDGLQFVGWFEITSLVEIDNFNFDGAEDNDTYYFMATYEKIYTVTFIDYLGNQIGTVVVSESNNNVFLKDCPEIPVREGYTSNWDSETLRNIKEDLIIVPIYEKIIFEVVFKDQEGNLLSYVNENGEIITKQFIAYGSFAIAPEYKQYYFNKTEMKLYEFSGWSAPFNQVKENLEIIAQYDTLYKKPVIAAKINGNRMSISLILPSNDAVLYSISVSVKWEVNQGTCYISDAILRGQSSLDERSDQGHTCTVGKKDEWLNYNNKSCTFNFIWNCGDGHKPNNTHYIENIFTLNYDVYDGAIFNESIFNMVESSVIIYGKADDDVLKLPTSKLMIWFYE